MTQLFLVNFVSYFTLSFYLYVQGSELHIVRCKGCDANGRCPAATL